MATDIAALSAKVTTSFQSLKNSAATLNAVSDELGKVVAQIDEGIRKLNLGLTVWVKLNGGDDTDLGGSNYWSEDIGYHKFNGKWGICIRKCDGDYEHMDDESAEVWTFSEAPRYMRIAAIDKIPELLQNLSIEAQKTTSRLQAKMADVTAVAEAINPPEQLRGFRVKGTSAKSDVPQLHGIAAALNEAQGEPGALEKAFSRTNLTGGQASPEVKK